MQKDRDGGDALAGWAQVLAQVKAAGAAIFARVWHVGVVELSMVGKADILNVPRLGLTGLPLSRQACGREMSTADIACAIGDSQKVSHPSERSSFVALQGSVTQRSGSQTC